MARVRIKGQGLNTNAFPWPVGMSNNASKPGVRVGSTLGPVPRGEANLEAEKGEIAALSTKSGIPDTFKIGGERHSQGGTPLNLPTDSFIFSDTPKMRIKDPVVLSQFGMPERKSGYTPAEIAKKYNINSFKRILLDKDTDHIQKRTAELMIANYNLKLAKLALVQESMKGFPQGIPMMAMPYIESMEIDPAEFVQMNPGEGDDNSAEQDAGMRLGGSLSQAQSGLSIGEGLRPAYDIERSNSNNWNNASYEDYVNYYRNNTYPAFTNNLNALGDVNSYSSQSDIDKYNQLNEIKNFIKTSPDSGVAYENQLIKHIYSPENSKSVDPRDQFYKKNTKAPFSMKSGSGFSNYTFSAQENAKKFAKAYPEYYSTFLSAMNSNNPVEMKNIAEEFYNYDVPNSLGMLPWTDQDKFQDLAGILEEQADKIIQSKQYSTSQPKDQETSRKADIIYANLVSEGNKLDRNSAAYLQNLALRDEVFKHTKEYKNLPSKTFGWTNRPNQWINDKVRMYSDNENSFIDNLYTKVSPKIESKNKGTGSLVNTTLSQAEKNALAKQNKSADAKVDKLSKWAKYEVK